MRNLKVLLFGLLAILPSHVFPSTEVCNFPAIFNFGDSSSDTGGITAAFGQALVSHPNGKTFFRRPAGRFSDGRLIIDFIAESLKLPYLSPFLDSVGSNFSHGANFAIAGSTIRHQNTTGRYSPFSLNVQLVQFSDFHRRSQIIRNQGGIFRDLLPEEERFKNGLYTFDIGGNDILAGYNLNMTTDQVKAYVPDLVTQLSNAIKEVYGQGGRNFWIHNIGPIGCLSYVFYRFPAAAAQKDEFGCATTFNDVSQFFNTKLKKSVGQLRKKLPLAAITYVDVYSAKYSLVTQAKKLEHCHFPAIFNFGDSNSDTGGLSAAFGRAPPPNGETFFGSPAGRFSDGRLIIDFIAESLKLPYLSPFLDSVGSNFSHGANFATAGSTIRPQNTTMSQSGYSPVSLNVQLVQFSDFRKRSQIIRNKGGIFRELLPEEEDFRKGLYTFDIGQNDLTAGYKLNMTTDQVKAYVPDLMTQLSDAITDIYAQGGRTFWIHNTGPVGCLPYVLDRFPVTAAQIDEFGCASPFNDVSQFFNRKLKEVVALLRKKLPLAAITYVDVYSAKYSLITQAKKLGFEDAFVACCGHGGKYNYNRFEKCGSKKMVNGKETVIAKSCKNPGVKINWDGTHFTEAANKWIFSQIMNGSLSDPPRPLNSACQQI